MPFSCQDLWEPNLYLLLLPSAHWIFEWHLQWNICCILIFFIFQRLQSILFPSSKVILNFHIPGHKMHVKYHGEMSMFPALNSFLPFKSMIAAIFFPKILQIFTGHSFPINSHIAWHVVLYSYSFDLRNMWLGWMTNYVYNSSLRILITKSIDRDIWKFNFLIPVHFPFHFMIRFQVGGILWRVERRWDVLIQLLYYEQQLTCIVVSWKYLEENDSRSIYGYMCSFAGQERRNSTSKAQDWRP